MPEQIPTLWAIGCQLATLLLNAVGFGWLMRTLKAERESLGKDAKAAIELAQKIRDIDLPTMRNDHSDLAQAVAGLTSTVVAIHADHEKMKELVTESLPRVVEGAIQRASEAASNAAWHRKRR